ncbi:hypothetical protein HK100_010368, partial [Physocladia obscura]
MEVKQLLSNKTTVVKQGKTVRLSEIPSDPEIFYTFNVLNCVAISARHATGPFVFSHIDSTYINQFEEGTNTKLHHILLKFPISKKTATEVYVVTAYHSQLLRKILTELMEMGFLASYIHVQVATDMVFLEKKFPDDPLRLTSVEPVFDMLAQPQKACLVVNAKSGHRCTLEYLD